MENRYCDLHTHSYYSDGTHSPRELIDEAERIGLSAIALCDHNTVSGLSEFVAAAEAKEIEAIPAVEFSTDYRGTELHVVGMFIKPEYYGTITEMMRKTQASKEESNRLLVERLAAAGYDLNYDEIRAGAGEQINRAHIAAALMEKGYAKTIEELFADLLSPNGKFYTPPVRPDVFEIITFIKTIGAVSVLAHPALQLKTEETLSEFLELAVPAGLNAMETEYSKFDKETISRLKSIAHKFRIKESGGSDYHGTRKPGFYLGRGRGDLFVPYDFVTELKECINDTNKA